MKEIEIKTMDRKYESFRLKDQGRERYLLSSIREKGVQEPLQCAQGDNGKPVLLDGFKRLRGCCRLNISTVPVVTVGTDEPDSILRLIHQSNYRTLNILEQAIFVNELRKEFKLKAGEIASRLERSPAWVSVRLGIFEDMSELIRKEVFAGKFPVRSYMYTLRQFTRVNKIKPQETDRFVQAVSGKALSQRQIETLAYGYFRGSPALKKQIEQGELSWTLKSLKQNEHSSASASPELTEEESRFIRDMELFQKYMQRLSAEGLGRSWDMSAQFGKTARVLADGILSTWTAFEAGLRRIHDCGQSA
jgi:ParB/RepB/Spo0J family partition protein